MHTSSDVLLAPLESPLTANQDSSMHEINEYLLVCLTINYSLVVVSLCKHAL